MSQSNPVMRIKDVSFSYPENERESVLNHISFSVQKGEYVALLGRNGSGKSSLARLFNALLVPDEGKVFILDFSSENANDIWQIRRLCGMVFQNPDNQIVGTTVEEDVAFGPENIGVPSPEIRRIVDRTLAYVNLSDFALRQPYELSGGQKQRLAIAGVLAMEPDIMILDEATSMLDPVGRSDFLNLVESMIQEKEITVIHITHDMYEASRANRILVLDQGNIVFDGAPEKILGRVEWLRSLRLDIPVFSELAYSFGDLCGCIPTEDLISTKDAAFSFIRSLFSEKLNKTDTGLYKSDNNSVGDSIVSHCLSDIKKDEKADCISTDTPLLTVENLSYAYDKDADASIQNISFHVNKGECIGIIGHSGSGKTTLITHLNGILVPQEGEVFINDHGKKFSTSRKSDIPEIRKRVGLLFQYPEYQLFEETVEKDVAYGPKQMGFSPEECSQRVKEALLLVGLDESFLKRSPFTLSGGEKRRAAFAGIIAMNPDILVLDEPAAGLDPMGRKEIFSYIRNLKENGKTIILVSHNMDEAMSCCDRLLVLKDGCSYGPWLPEELFSDTEKLDKLSVTRPVITDCMLELMSDIPDIYPWKFTVQEAAEELFIQKQIFSQSVSGKKENDSAGNMQLDTGAEK